MEDIRQLTRKQPFVPFRVFLTTGETFDIRHPDMIMASLGAAFIAAPSEAPDAPKDGTGAVKMVSLVHIQKIEFLAGPTTAQPGSNGPTAAP